MKKEYIEPKVKISSMECNRLMDTFSLPTTGEVEDPSFGQADEYGVWYEESEEDEVIPNYNIWDENL